MGSLRPRNSTRADKAHPRKPPPEPDDLQASPRSLLGGMQKGLELAHAVLFTVTTQLRYLPPADIDESRELAIVLDRLVGDHLAQYAKMIGAIIQSDSDRLLSRRIMKGGAP